MLELSVDWKYLPRAFEIMGASDMAATMVMQRENFLRNDKYK